MRSQATGGQTWPLTAPNEEPDVPVGEATRFDMNDVPIKAPSGPLAYYVPALLLTIIGVFVNEGEAPTAIPWDDIPRLLIKSVEVRDVWHGVPVSSAYWLGEHMRIHEFIGSGFKYGQRAGGEITPASEGGQSFAATIRIPLSGGGDLERETSLLALCYRPGSVNIEWKAATVLDTFSSGTTFTGTVRCDMELDPRAELMLGTPVEWVLHRTTSDANGTDIQIKNFGRASKLTGIEAKGGVLALMELANTFGQGGVFTASAVTRFGFDWRGQKPTRGIRAYLNQMIAQIDRRPDSAIVGTPTSSEFATFPYKDGVPQSDPLAANLRGWLMVMQGTRVRLTDVQCADQDQTYQFEVAGGFTAPGEHLILAQYAKVWSEAKRADWVGIVKQSGLDAYVLGKGAAAAQLRPRAPTDKHLLTADQTAFLPFQYV
jgi:hypothetical protein